MSRDKNIKCEYIYTRVCPYDMELCYRISFKFTFSLQFRVIFPIRLIVYSAKRDEIEINFAVQLLLLLLLVNR